MCGVLTAESKDIILRSVLNPRQKRIHYVHPEEEVYFAYPEEEEFQMKDTNMCIRFRPLTDEGRLQSG